MDKKCFSTAIYSVLLHVCVDGTTHCPCWHSVSAPTHVVSDLVSCFPVMYDNLKFCLCKFISSLNESDQSLSGIVNGWSPPHSRSSSQCQFWSATSSSRTCNIDRGFDDLGVYLVISTRAMSGMILSCHVVARSQYHLDACHVVKTILVCGSV